MTFPAGKVTGLIGHNGSGKSTLLKMLGRHHAASEGRVLLNDKPVEAWNSKAFARRRLSAAAAACGGGNDGTRTGGGRALSRHGALGRYGEEDRERVEEAIALVGLKPFAQRLVDSLSGGERQRAAGDAGGAKQPLPAIG